MSEFKLVPNPLEGKPACHGCHFKVGRSSTGTCKLTDPMIVKHCGGHQNRIYQKQYGT